MKPSVPSDPTERDGFARRAILNRLTAARGPMTAESIAALMNIDLALTRASLDALVACGYVIREGVLFRLPLAAA